MRAVTFEEMKAICDATHALGHVVVSRVRWVMKGGDVVVDKAGAPSRPGF